MIAERASGAKTLPLGGLAGAAVVVAIAALCDPLARLTAAPAPVFAVLLGLLAGCATRRDAFAPGYALWAKPGLKLGVALLGAQVAWADLMALGLPIAAASGALVGASLGVGTLIGLAVGLPLVEAIIAASAVAICGASAAMAAASALPETERSRRTTALVVIGVNLLSTAAMLAYPPIAQMMGLNHRQAGVFLGLSIHDVAQVAAAGAALSPDAATSAALAKLSRVLWLCPAISLAAILAARAVARRAGGQAVRLAPPPFVWGFATLVVMRSIGLLAQPIADVLADVSHLLLLGGVAAISAQVSPREILRLEPRLGLALVLTTAFIALFAMAIALTLVAFQG